MKKYYFYSRPRCFAYLIIALNIAGWGVLGLFVDQIYTSTIVIMILFFVSAVIVLSWFAFSLSSRIQIDYENEELYIITFYLIKRIKFEDIIGISMFDYKGVGFDIYITTRNFCRIIPYGRYINHRRPNKKITLKLNELENDLMRINNKEYKIAKNKLSYYPKT